MLHFCLLNYISNYAWDGTGSNGHPFGAFAFVDVFNVYAPKLYADYYCWQDRSGWNFRSVSKILNENSDPVDTFIITIDQLNPKRILNYQVLSQNNIHAFKGSNYNVAKYEILQ